MDSESIKVALITFALKEGASLSEIRAAYLEKTSQDHLNRVILNDEKLQKEFLQYHKAYMTLLKAHSQTDSVSDLNYYPQNQLARLHLNQGLYYLLQQDYLKAVEKFEEAYLINKHDTLIMVYMGILLIKRKSLYAAEKYFSDVVKAEPQNDDGWFYLGETFLKAQQYRKALTMFDTTKKLNPSRKEINARIKELSEKLKETEPPPPEESFFKRLMNRLKQE